MKIGIDVRPLQDPLSRGVSSYARPLVSEMLRQNSPKDFVLYVSGRQSPEFSRSDIEIRRAPLPSKLNNAAMRFFGSPTIDAMLGTEKIFLPNLNFWSLGNRAKATVTVHDLSFLVEPTWFSPKERLWHASIDWRGLLRKATSIITLSEHTKRELSELADLDEKKIFHIPPGIPEVAEATEPGPAFPYILFLGVLEPRKNIGIALKSFDILAAKNPEMHFVLAGAISPRSRLPASKFPDRVHFLGQISAVGKGALLRGASALFLPSLYEGFGFPPLEAMSVGVPVVASSAGALPETIGSAGLLLDPADTQGFADALASVCYDNDVRQLLVARGYERANNFSWKKCADETLKIIRDENRN